MADQQSASDIEQIAATSNENGLNTNEDDYSPSIDQIPESKQLAKERGIRIKELEIQIAQLNARLDTESHKAGTVYDRKGQEKKQLEKTIGQLEDDVRKVKRERDQLHNRLVSTKKYGVAVLLLSLMLVSMILFQLPICPECPRPICPECPRPICPGCPGCPRPICPGCPNMICPRPICPGCPSEICPECPRPICPECPRPICPDIEQYLTKIKTLTSQMTKWKADYEQLQSEKEKVDEKLIIEQNECSTISARLSDCMTGNNKDTVVSTDLGPGKLSQDYRGIYDQDYTMAIDELEEQKDTANVRETVRTFLDILKVAHELAEEYSMKHLVSMNQSVTSLLIEQPDTDSQDKKRHAWVNITLSPIELQDFYKIRQSSAWRMRENITEKLGEVVAERFRIDAESQPMMMTYVKNCVTLCWKANMRWDPVFIDFREPEAGTEFNFTLYRPFLHQTGSNLDYVVWPPMFEKRGGQLIAKGIAEKMD